MRFIVASGALRELIVESFLLLYRIIQLAEGIAQLESSGENLEPLHVIRVVGFLLGKRRDSSWVVVNDGGLNEVLFDQYFKNGRIYLAVEVFKGSTKSPLFLPCMGLQT